MYKQIIIARKDLNMSAGKLAAQVSHASMAFLLSEIRDKATYGKYGYYSNIFFGENLYEQWINGEYTKVILQARNKDRLYKAITLAQEIGMRENIDYFIIKDNCHTELTPEENGQTVTCIGFAPMDSEIIDTIGQKFHLYSE